MNVINCSVLSQLTSPQGREENNLFPSHVPHTQTYQAFWEPKGAAFHVSVSTTNRLATAAARYVSVVGCHPLIQPLNGSQESSWDLRTVC